MDERCEVPELLESDGGHLVRCHLPREVRRDIWENQIKAKLGSS